MRWAATWVDSCRTMDLTFDYPPHEPVGSFCLVVALTEYFHRRSDDGGTLRGIPGV